MCDKSADKLRENKYEIGDTVRYVTGGPRMLIVGTPQSFGNMEKFDYICRWFTISLGGSWGVATTDKFRELNSLQTPFVTPNTVNIDGRPSQQ